MSHDRKPGRAKVVAADAASAQRQQPRGPAADKASIARAAKARGRVRVLLIALFVLSSIGSAIAVELNLPS